MSVGICPFSPCQASRGHSISLTVSDIARLATDYTDSHGSKTLREKLRTFAFVIRVNPCKSVANLCLQHSHLELRYIRVQGRCLQSLCNGIARFYRIDDFVDP